MTRSTFRLLSPRAQLLFVMLEGTYLAHCWAEEGVLNLYYLPDRGQGFFAEVGFNTSQERILVRRSFTSSAPLAKYAHGISLPECLGHGRGSGFGKRGGW